MRHALLLLALVALSLLATGCPQMQQLSQTANELNKSANELNQDAKKLEESATKVKETATKVDGTVQRGKTALDKTGGLELEDENTQPATTNPETTTTEHTTEATCCVNNAFYECGGAAATAQCVGEPMPLMDCLGPCTDSTCEDACIEKHGPDPSACQRDESRDGECAD